VATYRRGQSRVQLQQQVSWRLLWADVEAKLDQYVSKFETIVSFVGVDGELVKL
jgi:hypothetical protein